jgi:hypothetical protein
MTQDTVHLDQTFIEAAIEAGRYENCTFDGCVCARAASSFGATSWALQSKVALTRRSL